MSQENPLRPVHPGEILREEFLAPLGLNAPKARWDQAESPDR
jgi:plasmid maintenance system antidote protein VapI